MNECKRKAAYRMPFFQMFANKEKNKDGNNSKRQKGRGILFICFRIGKTSVYSQSERKDSINNETKDAREKDSKCKNKVLGTRQSGCQGMGWRKSDPRGS